MREIYFDAKARPKYHKKRKLWMNTKWKLSEECKNA
jgi:hypothetical protein